MALRRTISGFARHVGGWLSIVSPLGWTVAALSVSAWFAGTQLGWRELLIIAATGSILLVVAALSTVGRLDLSSRLTVEPARVVVGERAAGSMIIRNESSRRSHAVRVELPVGRSLAVFAVPRLASHAEHDELFVVPTTRRTVIAVGPVTTVQGDVLGLIQRVRTWTDKYEIYVHPRTVPLATMAAGLRRDLEGQPTNQLTTSDVAFHTLRDYVPGDDRRHIHWKTSAKLDQLMIRQYVDTRRSHVCVLLSLDRREYLDATEFELAVSSAASVALQSLRDAQTLTVIAGAQPLPTTGPRALLDSFSRIEWQDSSGGLDDCFRRAREFAGQASVTTASAGQVLTLADVRRAASRAALETRIIVIRCEVDGPSDCRSVGGMSIVRLGELSKLRRCIGAVLA